MQGLLNGKTIIVSGGTTVIGLGIVKSFLQEDATVIVNASSSEEINDLHFYVKPISHGRLITSLTDDADFDKTNEIEHYLKKKYKKIDLVVVANDYNLPNVPLTETDFIVWQKMIDKCVSSHFMAGRIALHLMKQQRKGMFISLCNAGILLDESQAPLVHLASACQLQLSVIFSKEVKPFNIKYHHLFIGSTVFGFEKQDIQTVLYGATIETIVQHIIRLYRGGAGATDGLFQHLPNATTANNNNIFQSIKLPNQHHE